MPPATCSVAHCLNPATHAIRMSRDDAPPFEGVVCAEHEAQIDAGAPVRWDSDPADGRSGALLLGTDLEVTGLTITEVIAVEEHGLVRALDGDPAVTLVLEKLNPDASCEELRLTMSYEVMDQLASICTVFWRSRPGAEPAAGG